MSRSMNWHTSRWYSTHKEITFSSISFRIVHFNNMTIKNTFEKKRVMYLNFHVPYFLISSTCTFWYISGQANTSSSPSSEYLYVYTLCSYTWPNSLLFHVNYCKFKEITVNVPLRMFSISCIHSVTFKYISINWDITNVSTAYIFWTASWILK